MRTFQIKVAQATAVANYNILQGEKYKSANYKRMLKSAALVGSTNPGDCSVEFWAGESRLGKIFNSSGGANLVPKKDDLQYINAVIAKGSELQAKVVDAAVGNDIILQVSIDFVKTKKTYRRRYYRRRSF